MPAGSEVNHLLHDLRFRRQRRQRKPRLVDDRWFEWRILHRRGLRRARRQQKIGEEASLARPGIACGVNLPGTVGPGLSDSISMFHAGVSQVDLAFEHKIGRLTTMRVPRGPRARREVHQELYHLGL